MSEREQLEKYRVAILARFASPTHSRAVVKGFELRRLGLTPAQVIQQLNGKWTAEHMERADYFVFRREA
jgi:hypothetical protein